MLTLDNPPHGLSLPLPSGIWKNCSRKWGHYSVIVPKKIWCNHEMALQVGCSWWTLERERERRMIHALEQGSCMSYFARGETCWVVERKEGQIAPLWLHATTVIHAWDWGLRNNVFILFAVPLLAAKPKLTRIDRHSGSLEKMGILSYIVGNTLELHRNCIKKKTSYMPWRYIGKIGV
jgi:hypothetical protein